MRSARLLLLFLLPTLVFAQHKKHTLPAVFNTAQYVWVESMDGDEYRPDLLPADRQAITDVENALRDWGRYILTARRSEAQLVFVVRTGRLAEGKMGVGIGTRTPGPAANPYSGQQQPPAGPGVVMGSEVGPPDDLLQVCQLEEGSRLGNPIWERSESDGLASPSVPLFRDLKRAIDRDYPPEPPAKKP